MEQHVAAPPVGAPRSSLMGLGRYQFLIYRLFSLMGLFLSGYVTIHLIVNASILDSPTNFQTKVNQIHSLGPALPVAEWAFIFGPFLLHALVGITIIAGTTFNTSYYPYAKNWRFTFQRVTAVILLFFIIGHVLHMHHYGHFLGGGKFDPHHAGSSAAIAMQQGGMLLQIAYAIGVAAGAFHVANGIWTCGITWGVWVTPLAQRRANVLSWVIGLFLFVAGMGAISGLVKLDPEKAAAIESRMLKNQRLSEGADPASLQDLDSAAHAAEK